MNSHKRGEKRNYENEEPGTRKTANAPLRVLIIAPSLDIQGGQSRQAVRLISGLQQEASLNVDFLPHNPRLSRPWQILQKIKYVRTLFTTMAYWFLLLTRVGKYDLIHIFSASYYSYLFSAAPAILVARLYRKKCILNYRSGEADDHLRNWRLTAIPIMRLSHVIVVPSGYLVEVFAQFGLAARAIHNIVELDRFRFRERRPLRPTFLVSRLLEPLYNVACVLRAFALIQKRFPEASLTVAADGWLRPELEKLSRELSLQNTKFIGFVPFEKMPELYDAAEIYLTATDLDNMPSSITECMASGVPVVTTDAGGIPFIVTHEETCLMVSRDDHEAMAAAAMRDEWIKLYHSLATSRGDSRAQNDENLVRGARTAKPCLRPGHESASRKHPDSLGTNN